MKKGKGRIHPAPTTDAAAALSLLPAVALAAAAGLGAGDREVLAYLIARSVAAAASTGGVAPAGSPHGAAFGCGCFECYTSFWTRWDSSPDREAIHRAIEAFEEHLATSEKKGRKGKAKRREVEKRAEVGDGVAAVEKREQVIEIRAEEREAETEEQAAAERRSGWADVMGVLNSRLWTFWSSAN